MTTTISNRSALILLLSAATGLPVAAQTGVPNREALALRVSAAHRPDGPTAKIESFRSNIVLELHDSTQDKGGQAELSVDYLEFQPPGKTRSTTLLRYEVRGAERPIVRGADMFGPWHLHRGKPTDLTGADFSQDLESFLEHRNLAKQLVRFLSPGEVIRSLTNTSEVIREQLQLTRRKTIEVLSIEGDIEKFPMMQAAGDEAPARLKIYVDPKTNHLIAVDAWPLEKGKADPNKGERIKLGNLQNRSGLLVPHRLNYLWRDQRGQLRSHSQVNMIKLDLQPELTQQYFDRR
jgi:hypothetical protein